MAIQLDAAVGLRNATVFHLLAGLIHIRRQRLVEALVEVRTLHDTDVGRNHPFASDALQWPTHTHQRGHVADADIRCRRGRDHSGDEQRVVGIARRMTAAIRGIDADVGIARAVVAVRSMGGVGVRTARHRIAAAVGAGVADAAAIGRIGVAGVTAACHGTTGTALTASAPVSTCAARSVAGACTGVGVAIAVGGVLPPVGAEQVVVGIGVRIRVGVVSARRIGRFRVAVRVRAAVRTGGLGIAVGVVAAVLASGCSIACEEQTGEHQCGEIEGLFHEMLVNPVG